MERWKSEGSSLEKAKAEENRPPFNPLKSKGKGRGNGPPKKSGDGKPAHTGKGKKHENEVLELWTSPKEPWILFDSRVAAHCCPLDYAPEYPL